MHYNVITKKYAHLIFQLYNLCTDCFCVCEGSVVDVFYFIILDGEMKSFIGGEFLRSKTADDKQG